MLPATRQRWFPAFIPDEAGTHTPFSDSGGITELSWPGWSLYPKIIYSRKSVTYLRNNQAVSWPGNKPAIESCKSNVLTTRLPSLLRRGQVAANRHKPMILQHIVWPSIACANGRRTHGAATNISATLDLHVPCRWVRGEGWVGLSTQ